MRVCTEQVLAGSSMSASNLTASGVLTREPSLTLPSPASDGGAPPALPSPPTSTPGAPPASRSFFGNGKNKAALPAPPAAQQQQPASPTAANSRAAAAASPQGGAGAAAAQEEGGKGAGALARVVRDQNLEIECDIEFSRLKQYLEDGNFGLQNGTSGFRGIHVHSQCSYFKGFMWGIKLVFGFSTGHGADGTPPPFTVTPSPFASLPPGEGPRSGPVAQAAALLWARHGGRLATCASG